MLARPNVSGPIGSPQASASAFGAGIAQQIGNVGVAVENIGERLYEHNRKRDIWNNELNMAESVNYWTEWMVEAEKNAPPGAPDFVAGFKEKWEPYVEEYLANIRDPEIRAHSERTFKANYGKFLGEAIGFEAKSSTAQNILRMEQSLNSYQNIVTAHPEQLDNAEQNALRLIANTPNLDNQQRSKLAFETRQNFINGALTGVVSKFISEADNLTPQEVQRQIDALSEPDNKWLNQASPDVYAKALGQLRGLKDHVTEQQAQYLVDDIHASYDQIAAFGENGKYLPEWIINNISDPRQRSKLLAERDVAVAVGTETVWARNASDIDIERRQAQLALELPKSNDYRKDSKVFAALGQVAEMREKAMEKDPVAYTLSVSPVSQEAYSKLDGTPEKRQDFIRAASIDQQHLSPYSEPKVLTGVEIEQFKTVASTMAINPTGVEDFVGFIQSKTLEYGKYWPKAARELISSGNLSPAQIVVANMGYRPETQALSKELLQSEILPENDLDKLLAGNPAVSQSAIDKVSVAAFSDLAQVSKFWVNGLGIVANYTKSLSKLIRYKVAHGEGNAVGKARDFANQMFLDRYEFEDTYAIPVEQPVKAIKSVADEILPNLENWDIVIPSNFPSTSQEESRELFFRRNKDEGVIVSKADGSGLRVLDKNGNDIFHRVEGEIVPLEFDWDELKALNLSGFGD